MKIVGTSTSSARETTIWKLLSLLTTEEMFVGTSCFRETRQMSDALHGRTSPSASWALFSRSFEEHSAWFSLQVLTIRPYFWYRASLSSRPARLLDCDAHSVARFEALSDTRAFQVDELLTPAHVLFSNEGLIGDWVLMYLIQECPETFPGSAAPAGPETHNEDVDKDRGDIEE